MPWLHHVFSLSLRDVKLILAERGIAVTHESIRHWCLKFGADFARRLRQMRPQPDDTWHIDEVFVRIRGVLHYLWRAMDQLSWQCPSAAIQEAAFQPRCASSPTSRRSSRRVLCEARASAPWSISPSHDQAAPLAGWGA
jgi:hypothetical protein